MGPFHTSRWCARICSSLRMHKKSPNCCQVRAKDIPRKAAVVVRSTRARARVISTLVLAMQGLNSSIFFEKQLRCPNVFLRLSFFIPLLQHCGESWGLLGCKSPMQRLGISKIAPRILCGPVDFSRVIAPHGLKDKALPPAEKTVIITGKPSAQGALISAHKSFHRKKPLNTKERKAVTTAVPLRLQGLR